MVLGRRLKVSAPVFLDMTREKFQTALATESGPHLAWFSLNDACNLDCKYCFADARYLSMDPDKPIEDFLSTADVKQIVDNVVDSGTQQIMFAGGEPTLRRDLAEIVAHASARIPVAMNTNGYLMTEAMARELAQAGLTQVKVSVDGLRERHDWNRGPGSYDRAMEALRMCKEAGIPTVILIMTLSAVNYDDLPALLELTLKSGADFTLVEFLPIGKAAGRKEWCLTRDQVRDFQHLLAQAQQDHGWTRVAFENRYIVSEDEHCKEVCLDPFRPCGFEDFCVGCISGIYSYVINARGQVAAGDIMTLECGDLRQESLASIWKNAELFQRLRDREGLGGKCGRCKYRYICGGCRRRAYALTGDLMAADPGCWVDPADCLVD